MNDDSVIELEIASSVCIRPQSFDEAASIKSIVRAAALLINDLTKDKAHFRHLVRPGSFLEYN